MFLVLENGEIGFLGLVPALGKGQKGSLGLFLNLVLGLVLGFGKRQKGSIGVLLDFGKVTKLNLKLSLIVEP